MAENSKTVRFVVRTADAPGGVARSVLNLAGHLAPRYDVEVVSMFRQREHPAFAAPAGVRVTYLEDRQGGAEKTSERWLTRVLRRLPTVLIDPCDSIYRVSSWSTDLKLARVLRGSPDCIVITTRPSLHVAAARLCPASTVVIGQEHMSFEARPRQLLRTVRRHADGLDALVVLSDRDRADYERFFDAPGGRAPRTFIRTIVNAAPFAITERVAPPAQRERLIVAAGGLRRQKGFDRLIKAFGPLAAEFPDWRLEIYGTGPEEARLKELISERGLDAQVALMGFSDDLPSVMERGSVFALSSRYEGLPMVVIEALARGLPVVAFDCPRGPRELVCTGRNGFLIRNGNLVAYRKALRRLMADDQLRHRLACGALADAPRYDVAAVAPQWEALLDDIAQRRAVTTGARRRLQLRLLLAQAARSLHRGAHDALVRRRQVEHGDAV
jgi:glycosyltransferase involved in cell wall biosynthesis